MKLNEYIERKYEKDFGESWSALEERVRERNKDFFVLYDSFSHEEEPEVRKWWQIWR